MHNVLDIPKRGGWGGGYSLGFIYKFNSALLNFIHGHDFVVFEWELTEDFYDLFLFFYTVFKRL